MGRYLAVGVAVSLLIRERKENTLKEEKDKLIKQIGKFIDLEHYDIFEKDDYLLLNIKTDYFNNNIHNDYKEFKKVLNLSDDSYKPDDEGEMEFNKENYPLNLKLDKENEEFVIEYQGDNWSYPSGIDNQPFASNVWIFGDQLELFDNFRVFIDYFCIYRDIEKILIEDDRNLLRALNILCKKTFTKGLCKDISFYISG